MSGAPDYFSGTLPPGYTPVKPKLTPAYLDGLIKKAGNIDAAIQAAPDDETANALGARSSAPTPDYFSSTLPVAGKGGPSPSKPAKAPPAAPLSGGASSPLGRAGDAVASFYDKYIGKPQETFGAGATQGMRDVVSSFDPVAKGIESLTGPVTLGGLLPTAGQAHSNNLAARNAYEGSDAGNSTIGGAGRLAGQSVAALPVMAAVGGLLGTVGKGAGWANRLLQMGSRAVQGAELGAEGAAVTSGGSDDPIADQMMHGAELGGVLGPGTPLALMTGRAAGRGFARLIRPLTKAGQDAIGQGAAMDTIDHFGGSVTMPHAGERVPGSKPTLAEVTGNPGVAGLQRAIQELNPNSPLIARQAENNEARSVLFDATKGNPEELALAVKARDAAADSHLKQIFAKGNADRTDIGPVKQTIADILSGPSGNRTAVRSAVNDVLKVMNDANGKPTTDPEKLYHSVRMEIKDLLDGTDLNKGYGKQAARQLIAIRDSLDDAIESGAPGFKKYLSDYAASSAPITSMEFLQGLHLTNAKGEITLNNVNSAINRLNAQREMAGIKKGKAVTDAQISNLEAIRDDLLRKSNIDLGRAAGSNTVQNAMLQKRLGLAAHITPGSVGAGVGTAIGGMFGAPAMGGLVGERAGSLAGKFMPDVNALTRASMQHHLEELLLHPERYSEASAAHAQSAPSAVNLLQSGAGLKLVPSAVITKNRLMGSDRGR